MSNKPRYAVLTQPVNVPCQRRTVTGLRVALVEVAPGFQGTPRTIREGAPGVSRIVRDYGLASAGTVAQAEAYGAALSRGV